jgi:hypothetical protein
MKKITFTDLLDMGCFTPPTNFTLASKAVSVRNSVQRIADNANQQMIENGEFATMFAENVQKWLAEIAEQADEVVDLILDLDKKLKAEGEDLHSSLAKKHLNSM